MENQSRLTPRSPGRWLGWLWRHRKRCVFSAFLFGFLLLNLMAYVHARAMTHFVRGGERTMEPEKLTTFGKANVLFFGVRVPRPENATTPESVSLPFTNHRFAGSNGTELATWHIDCPQARALILLLHGYAACKANLLQEAKAFHDMGYATLLVDFSGSGDSSGSVTTIGVREADDVACAMTYAQSRWPGKALILYGQSMGSAAILRAIAINKVRPTAVAIECPFNKLLATVENRFTALSVPSFPAARLLVFWGGLQHGFNGFSHNPTDYARDVTCPVLLLHGSADPRVTQEQAREVFDQLAGEKHFEVFEGVGHESYLTARPEKWRQCVAAFLATQTSKSDWKE